MNNQNNRTFCSNCGKENASNNNFCIYCGSVLNINQQTNNQINQPNLNQQTNNQVNQPNLNQQTNNQINQPNLNQQSYVSNSKIETTQIKKVSFLIIFFFFVFFVYLSSAGILGYIIWGVVLFTYVKFGKVNNAYGIILRTVGGFILFYAVMILIVFGMCITFFGWN